MYQVEHKIRWTKGAVQKRHLLTILYNERETDIQPSSHPCL